jgi:CHAT domain-containing protein/tetratricopeptide (TPR) repeat protein
MARPYRTLRDIRFAPATRAIVVGMIVLSRCLLPIGPVLAGASISSPDFDRVYQLWLETSDPKQQVELGDRLIAEEPRVARWQLSEPRELVKGDVLRGTAQAYAALEGSSKADNLEKAIRYAKSALAVFADTRFHEQWADTNTLLADLYKERVVGNHADNIEIAITNYEQAATVRTQKAYPQQWALIANSLGVTYIQRAEGDLAENVEKSIRLMESALSVIDGKEHPTGRAQVHYNLGVAYGIRNMGNVSDKFEKIIEHLEAALSGITRDSAPNDWAEINSLLGAAYSGRTAGSLEANIRRAIACLESEITVHTQEDLPDRWGEAVAQLGKLYISARLPKEPDLYEKSISYSKAALESMPSAASPEDKAKLQVTLGQAYGLRMKGDESQNIEDAIRTLESAVTVWRDQIHSSERAEALNMLGLLYGKRIAGERAQNLEEAIARYNLVLRDTSPDTIGDAWGNAHAALGLAYMGRQRGEKEYNIENAIAHFESAQTVFSREKASIGWARTEGYLGYAYSGRIRGDADENTEKAIAHYKSSLEVADRQTDPATWATNQNALGILYTNLRSGDPAQNLRTAISYIQAALSEWTPESTPKQWAGAQINLAVFFNELSGDQKDNIAKALGYAEAVQSTFSRGSNPYFWALAQQALAHIYEHRWKFASDPTDLEKAIAGCRAALEIQTLDRYPREHLTTSRLLGSIYLKAGKWQPAADTYSSARDAFLLLFGEGLDPDAAKELLARDGGFFSDAAFAFAQLGQNENALSVFAEGKARLLAVALRLNTLATTEQSQERLRDLRSSIRVAEHAAENSTAAERGKAVEKLSGLRGELLAYVKQVPVDRSVASNVLSRVGQVIGETGVLVAPIVTRAGSKLLIVSNARSSDDISLVDVPQLTEERLRDFIGARTNDNRGGGWLAAYNINYLPDEELHAHWKDWLAAVDNVGTALWILFGADLKTALDRRGVKPGSRLIWLPTGALGILPLGLTQNPSNKQRLADEYDIVYAPSLETLTNAQDVIFQSNRTTLAAVINPTGDLPGTEKEGAIVAAHFAINDRVLVKAEAATAETVLGSIKGKSYWHFASHGRFSWTDARQSALLMHGDVGLTVGQIMDADGVGRPRLVVLSACETGLYDINEASDEFIGLPTAFLALGAAGVMSSLWPVADWPTELLMARFYEYHLDEGLAPSIALSRAQAWLRQATQNDIRDYGKMVVERGRLSPTSLAEIEHDLSLNWRARRPNRGALKRRVFSAPSVNGTAAVPNPDHPYEHPYYWAGFIYSGF